MDGFLNLTYEWLYNALSCLKYRCVASWYCGAQKLGIRGVAKSFNPGSKCCCLRGVSLRRHSHLRRPFLVSSPVLGCFRWGLAQADQWHPTVGKSRKENRISMNVCIFVYCLLITLTCSPKAELRRAQLNGIGWMHVKSASGSRQTAMNDLGAQLPSQIFLTWVKARPQTEKQRKLFSD